MSKNILPIVEALEKLECQDEASRDILGRMFDSCVKLHDFIEGCDLPSNGKEYQDAVSVCIKHLEKCTHMVNELDLFSSNEVIEEIETSSIKFLLIPALLGNLNLALQSKDQSERMKYLQIAEVYFKDFLLRCKNYELSKKHIINKYENQMLDDINEGEIKISRKPNVNDMIALRESKIEQYKLKKELKTREDELKPALERQDADEYIREYYLLILERWILTAVEELQNIQSEKFVLGNMLANKEDSSQLAMPKACDVKPLKPIIITRNEIQKKVFGLGYPSIPVMTIEDFYRQRFEKMVKEHKNNSQKSLQDRAMTGDALSREEEEMQKEMLLEQDDVEALEKARVWDDWKDDNPRGSGNRKNKG